jgi:hypothetical protein
MVVGLNGFDKPDRAYRDKVIGIRARSGIFFHDMRHQPQIMAYQLVAGGSVSCGKTLETAAFLGGGQRLGEFPLALEMEREKQKSRSEQIYQQFKHGLSPF